MQNKFFGNASELPLPKADDISRGVLRLFAELGLCGLTEMTLANGRRADVVALCQKGQISIVEIKSSVADFRSDQKWPEYQPFCDQFYFAVGTGLSERPHTRRSGPDYCRSVWRCNYPGCSAHLTQRGAQESHHIAFWASRCAATKRNKRPSARRTSTVSLSP